MDFQLTVGMATRITGWLRRLRDGVRQAVAVLGMERNGLLAGATAEGLGVMWYARSRETTD